MVIKNIEFLLNNKEDFGLIADKIEQYFMPETKQDIFTWYLSQFNNSKDMFSVINRMLRSQIPLAKNALESYNIANADLIKSSYDRVPDEKLNAIFYYLTCALPPNVKFIDIKDDEIGYIDRIKRVINSQISRGHRKKLVPQAVKYLLENNLISKNELEKELNGFEVAGLHKPVLLFIKDQISALPNNEIGFKENNKRKNEIDFESEINIEEEPKQKKMKASKKNKDISTKDLLDISKFKPHEITSYIGSLLYADPNNQLAEIFKEKILENEKLIAPLDFCLKHHNDPVMLIQRILLYGREQDINALKECTVHGLSAIEWYMQARDADASPNVTKLRPGIILDRLCYFFKQKRGYPKFQIDGIQLILANLVKSNLFAFSETTVKTISQILNKISAKKNNAHINEQIKAFLPSLISNEVKNEKSNSSISKPQGSISTSAFSLYRPQTVETSSKLSVEGPKIK